MNLEQKVRDAFTEKMPIVVKAIEVEDTNELLLKAYNEREDLLAKLRQKIPSYSQQIEPIQKIWMEERRKFFAAETPEEKEAFKKLLENWDLNPVEIVLKEEVKRLLDALKEAVFMNERRPAAYKTIMPKAYTVLDEGTSDILENWQCQVEYAQVEDED